VSAIQRWRAPQADGAVLADPPLSSTGQLLADNRRLLDTDAVRILGQPLAELRAQARREAVAAATNYLRQAGEPVPDVAPDSLVLAGHQPELFHAGVWVKNFALSGIARAGNCAPLNLIVDNDTAKSTALRLPARSGEGAAEDCGTSVGLATVPFDTWAGEVPYEERAVHDEALFASFADRATEVLRPWGIEPLLPVFWAEACRQVGRTLLLGERLAAARRTLERRWGCRNLEVPLSALCRTESFAWFACHLLFHLPNFHQTYNDAVQDHRRRHGIKSRNHPVPDLVRDGDWLETPLWGWRSGQTRRGRLMARLTANQIELRAGPETWPALPRSCDVRAAVAAWRDLERRGFKVRSRALTTTLYARLLVGDLFVHGIGGAKYDALTDEIIRRFFHLQPPAFLMLSATLHLPLATYPARPEKHAGLARKLRDLHCNPQRHLSGELAWQPEVARLVQQKEDWIARQPQAAAEKRERFHRIRTLSERLETHLVDQERLLRRQLDCTERQLSANMVLQRRDYAFCLFPEAKIRPFCEHFLNVGEPRGVSPRC
jgi:hypothetical protein